MKPVWNVDTVSTLKWQKVELREAGTVTIVTVSSHFFCDSLHGLNYQFVQINSRVLKSIDMGSLPCESKLGYENPVNYPTGVEYLLERERKRIRHSKSITKLMLLCFPCVNLEQKLWNRIRAHFFFCDIHICINVFRAGVVYKNHRLILY